MNHLIEKLSGGMLICALLAGCTAKVDLDNLDPSVKLDMGLAMPIGEMQLRLGDVLHIDTMQQISINANGAYEVAVSTSFEESTDLFDVANVDLSSLETTTVKQYPIGSKLAAHGLTSGIPVPVAVSHFDTIDFTIRFSEINRDLSSIRLDSIIVNRTTLLMTANEMIGLGNDALRNPKLILPADGLRRPQGQEVAFSGVQFNQSSEQQLGLCHLILMADPSAQPSNTNLCDSMRLRLAFEIVLQAGQSISFDPSSTIDFSVTTRVDEIGSIYGFIADDYSTDVDTTLLISRLWNGYDAFRRLCLPLADPSVDVTLYSDIAIPLKGGITDLKVENEQRTESRELTVNGQAPKAEAFSSYVRATDPVGTRAEQTWHYGADNSNIGQLFAVSPRPEQLHLGVNFGIDNQRAGVVQHRIDKQMTLGGSLALRIPFEFGEGLDIAYSDTMDLDLSSLSLDSLLGSQDIVDSVEVKQLTLAVTAKNYLPFRLGGTVVFLDANKHQVQLGEGKEFTISAPSDYGQSGPATPGTGVLTISLDQNKADQLSQVKYAVYSITLTDGHVQGSYPLILGPDCNLSLKMALTANLAAYLKLEFNNAN